MATAIDPIQQILTMLQQGGLFGFFLPLLLIFVVVFGIFDKSRLFGENKKIPAVVGFIIALYATAFSPLASFVQNISMITAFILIIILFLVIIAFFIPKKKIVIPWAWVGFITGLAIFIVVAAGMFRSLVAFVPLATIIQIENILTPIAIFIAVISGLVGLLSYTMGEEKRIEKKIAGLRKELSEVKTEPHMKEIQRQITELESKLKELRS